MKIHTGGCRVCRGILKPEEVRRGTCSKCEEEVTKFINEKLDSNRVRNKLIAWR